MILDTSFVIALTENEAAREMARDHERRGVPQRLPTVALAELYVSVGLGTDSYDNARKYEELLGNLAVVPLDENVARRGGAVAGILAASNDRPTIGLVDALVAATGLVYNEPVVTADADDFERVDGLDVVTWG
jgi:tRNA(fMet)-specific endonuclease VapC